LNLQSCEEIYEGKIGPEFKMLLQTPFFQNIFRKYAFYVIEQDRDDVLINTIPTTEEDTLINPNLVPFNDELFLHQKKEIGFLYSREQCPS